jgi:hypothetical protein
MDRQLIYRAVGAVSQNCAQLEVNVAIVAWGLAGLDQPVARIVVPNSMDSMLGLIKALLPVRVADEGLRGRVVAWCGEVKAAYSERSAVIHSLWIPNDEHGTYVRAHLKPLKGGPEVRTLAEIVTLAETLYALANTKVDEFMTDLVAAAPGPWSVIPAAELPPGLLPVF